LNISALHGGKDGMLYTSGPCNKVWEPQGLKKVKEFPFSISTAIIIRDNSSFLVFGERGPPGGSVAIINKATSNKLRDFDLGLYSPNDISVSETHCLVVNGPDVHLISLETMQEVKTIQCNQGIPACAFYNDNFMYYDGGKVKIFDIKSFEAVKTFDAPSTAKFLVQGDNLIVAGSVDATIFVYDLKTYKQIAAMSGHGMNGCSCLGVDGPILYSGGDSLKMWDLTHFGLVNSIAPPDPGYMAGFTLWNGKVASYAVKDVLIWE